MPAMRLRYRDMDDDELARMWFCWSVAWLPREWQRRHGERQLAEIEREALRRGYSFETEEEEVV